MKSYAEFIDYPEIREFKLAGLNVAAPTQQHLSHYRRDGGRVFVVSPYQWKFFTECESEIDSHTVITVLHLLHGYSVEAISMGTVKHSYCSSFWIKADALMKERSANFNPNYYLFNWDVVKEKLVSYLE